ILRAELDQLGRVPAAFAISKRVFLSMDDRVDRARSELQRWFGTVYFDAALAERSGIHGTPDQVREQLEDRISGRESPAPQSRRTSCRASASPCRGGGFALALYWVRLGQSRRST